MRKAPALALALLLAGCGGNGPAPAPWRVEVAGCETWVAPAACVLGKQGSGLRIWVAGGQPVELQLDGRRLEIAAEAAEAGLSFTIPVPPGARRLRFARPDQDELTLTFAPSLRPAAFDEIATLALDADPLKQAEALALLARQPDGAPAWKPYFQARSAYFSGRRGEAVVFAEAGAAAWQTDGREGYRINELALASHLAGNDAVYPEGRRLLDLAARALDDLEGWPFRPVRLRFLVAHQRATLAYQTGNVRTAFAGMEELESFERKKLLDVGEISDLYQLEANVLAELGRFEEAARILDRLLALDEDPNRRAGRALNRGWVTLLARQAYQTTEDPSPYFQQAWEYYRVKGEGHQKLNSLINLAAAALLDRRLEAARSYLEQARPFRAQATAHEGFMFDWLEARLLLLRGAAQAALDRFQELDLEASRRHLPAALWQALVGKAEALAALGKGPAAIDAFARAEGLERRDLIFIPLDHGRETFLAQREWTTRRHLDLLLAAGRKAEALELVRRRRIQPLTLLERDERVASLGEEGRRAWDEAAADYQRLQGAAGRGGPEAGEPLASRAESSLGSRNARLEALIDTALARLGLPDRETPRRPPQPGELTLAFFPMGGAWLVFALDRQGLDLQSVDAAPGTPLAAVAAALLQKVAPRIEACRRLRILPWGELDLHAVEFEGAPLLAARPVVYGVDAGPAPVASEGGRRRGLLVVDASKLEWALAEIEFAEGVLGPREGMELEPTLVNHEATPQLVRAGLQRADFFHFAGHGEFDPAGSQSRLLLPGGAITAADVLTLRRVPGQVLLSSCYVGQPARAAGIEGLGLAYAFVLTGSRQVLAATRQVDDLETAALIHQLYETIAAAPGEIDLAVALQQAQLALSRSGEGDAWKAFRVFEP